jgi:hypothetical protein
MAPDRRNAGWAQCMGNGLAAVLCAAAMADAAMAAAAPALPPASSSTLSLGPRGVQTLVADQLFDRKGRWYLTDDEGVCYTYLESPHVRLASDRLVLKAHMVSRLGQRFGNNCVGTDLEDEAVRNALNLALQVNPDSIPRTARIDVLESLRKQPFTAGGFAVHIDEFHIASIATRNDTLVIQFDLNLSAP